VVEIKEYEDDDGWKDGRGKESEELESEREERCWAGLMMDAINDELGCCCCWFSLFPFPFPYFPSFG
jgi:hypothetical protein